MAGLFRAANRLRVSRTFDTYTKLVGASFVSRYASAALAGGLLVFITTAHSYFWQLYFELPHTNNIGYHHK